MRTIPSYRSRRPTSRMTWFDGLMVLDRWPAARAGLSHFELVRKAGCHVLGAVVGGRLVASG